MTTPAIAEVPPQEVIRGTVGLDWKVQTRKYEHAVASIYMPFEFVPGDATQTEENAKQAFFQAKAIVFEQLGIEFELTDDGVLMAVIQRHLGPVTDVTGTEEAVPESAVDSGGSNVSEQGSASKTGVMRVLKFNADLGPVDYLPHACPDCGGTEVWDNRADVVGTRRPHFKCANKSGGTGGKPCGKGFWPPRDN